jgi:predicted membrane channel-forming protein YqfA (hemolysin III family)
LQRVKRSIVQRSTQVHGRYATGQVNNLHNLMSTWEFLGYGLLSVFLAALVSIRFHELCPPGLLRSVSRKLSHEAIIGTFVGLVLVIGYWEGQYLGLLVIVTIGLIGGLLYRTIGFNTGVQFMGLRRHSDRTRD